MLEGDRRQAARRAEPRRKFVGQALVLDETLLARQPDGIFIEAHRVHLPPFQTRNFCADQCRAVCESGGTVLRPERDLVMMAFQSLQVPGSLLGRGRIATRRPTKRPVEMVLRQLYLCRHGPK